MKVVDTKELATRVLELLRNELPDGVAKQITRGALQGTLSSAVSAEFLFARLMIDHGYTFADAYAAFEAVRQLEQ